MSVREEKRTFRALMSLEWVWHNSMVAWNMADTERWGSGEYTLDNNPQTNSSFGSHVITNLEQFSQRCGKSVKDQFDFQPKLIGLKLMTIPKKTKRFELVTRQNCWSLYVRYCKYLALVSMNPLLYWQRYIVSLSSDKCTYCKSLWIKASAKCPKWICRWRLAVILYLLKRECAVRRTPLMIWKSPLWKRVTISVKRSGHFWGKSSLPIMLMASLSCSKEKQ